MHNGLEMCTELLTINASDLHYNSVFARQEFGRMAEVGILRSPQYEHENNIWECFVSHLLYLESLINKYILPLVNW